MARKSIGSTAISINSNFTWRPIIRGRSPIPRGRRKGNFTRPSEQPEIARVNRKFARFKGDWQGQKEISRGNLFDRGFFCWEKCGIAIDCWPIEGNTFSAGGCDWMLEMRIPDDFGTERGVR